MKEVPVIDISQDPHEVAKKVNEACIKWGFFVVSGHGVSEGIIESMFAVSYKFFDLSEDTKLKYDKTKDGRGYYSLRKKALARTYGDLNAPGDEKESFTSGDEPIDGDPYYFTPEAEGHFTENIWPLEIPYMKRIWMQYREACQGVCDNLFSIMDCSLKADKPLLPKP